MLDRKKLQWRAVLAGAACLLPVACGDGAPDRSSSAADANASAGRILFSQTTGEHRDIYAIRPDGSGLRHLTKSRGEAVWPEPSPDGRKIAYEDDEGTRAVIAVVDADGGDRRVLTPSGFQGAWRTLAHAGLGGLGREQSRSALCDQIAARSLPGRREPVG
jgi:hypothetical protein